MPKNAKKSSYLLSGLITFKKQLFILVRRNTLLQLREWKTIWGQTVISPCYFMILLFVLQQADYLNQMQTNQNPARAVLPGVLGCDAVTGNPNCINILYNSPNRSQTDLIMQAFATQNSARTSQTAFAIETPLTDATQLPTRPLGIVPVPSSDFLYDYTLRHPAVPNWGITFFVQNAPNYNVQYQIWYNSTRVANGTDVFGRQVLAFSRGIDEAIISVLNSNSANINYANLNITVRDWPVVPPLQLSDTVVQNLGPMFFFCCIMVTFINVLIHVVSERQLKLRQNMEVSGLQPAAYWCSIYISNSVLVLIASLTTTVLGYAFQFRIFLKTDFLIMFITIFLFGEAMIAHAFLYSSMFIYTTQQATWVAIFMFIVGILIEGFVFSDGYIGFIFWKPTSLSQPIIDYIAKQLPYVTFGKLIMMIATFTNGELNKLTGTYSQGTAFEWINLMSPMPVNLLPVYPDGQQAIPPVPIEQWYILLYSIASSLIFTWYFDNILPNEFGYYRPLWFFLLPSYWGADFRGSDKSQETWILDTINKATIPTVQNDDLAVSVERQRVLNEIGDNNSVKLVYLRKEYMYPKKLAVTGMCMEFKEGELFALLGQNGAGKTTTMNMLSGVILPTSGDAFMYGCSLKSDIYKIRKIMGVCPQYDILYPELTAREHIELYAGIKGVSKLEVDRVVERQLSAVYLTSVVDAPVKTYSGGMKRRLSLVIATIGDPKILFLDEPTTGMDPVNRRHVWSFIEKLKKDKVVVLTTHSMEEAEVLGDRVGVMGNGRLTAIGTPTELKQKFGAGYRVTIVTNPALANQVHQFVLSIVPRAVLEDQSAGSMMYHLDKDCLDMLPELVRQLEKGRNKFINTWGLSQTTLEEVFLKLAKGMKRE